MMQRNFIWFWVLMVLLFLTNSSCAQNVALHKNYTISEKPNYSGSAPSADTNSLTDGIYTSKLFGRFWTQKTTVGWKGKSVIEIEIDLEKNENISSIYFTSAAGTAEVYFPKNVFVFGSINGEHYEYLGDIMEDQNEEYKSYTVKQFRLEAIKRKARYIRLIVLPEKKYFFMDEIEIRVSKKQGKVVKAEIPDKTVLQYVRDIKTEEFDMKRLKLLESTYIKKKIFDPKKSFGKAIALEEIESMLASHLNSRFNRNLIVEKQSPWEKMTSGFIPDSHADHFEYNFRIFKGFSEYGSFTITNSDQRVRKVEFSSSLKEENINLELFHSLFVETGEIEKTSDALIPLNSELVLNPGETALVFFKIKGITEGKFTQQLIISNGEESSVLELSGFVKSEVDSVMLNANVWAYLDYPSLSGIQKEAGKDLDNHHINTAIIKTSSLPSLHKPEQLLKFQAMLRNYKQVDHFLLYINLKHDTTKHNFWKASYLSEQWKINFKKWYDSVEKEIKKLFPNAHIYFYPYDEINTEKDIQDFQELVNWRNKDFPEMKFYATLTKERVIQQFIDQVAIAHIPPRLIKIKNVVNSQTEVWTYENVSSARSSSPYNSYRMKAWKAYIDGSKGIGFWNYAFQEDNFYDEFLFNPPLNYAIIYNNGNQIIGSRRWEAFSKGLEDYALLKAYEEKYGQSQTLQLVQQVLDNIADISLAEEVISKIKKSI